LAGISSRYFPGNSAPLRLTNPVWVGVTSTHSGFGHHWGRNGEFCVAVGAAIRTAGILAEVG